jgi:hypothetical protein
MNIGLPMRLRGGFGLDDCGYVRVDTSRLCARLDRVTRLLLRCEAETPQQQYSTRKHLGAAAHEPCGLSGAAHGIGNGTPQIGDLSGVINSIGPYITGDFIEPDDVVNMKELNDNGKKYFVYELNTPYAMTGAYNIASVTTSQNELVLIVVSASEKQYNSAEAKLRRIAESFRV